MDKTFSINHPLLLITAGIIVAVVAAQSVYFLVRALKHAKELGFSNEKLKKICASSAIFSIAPAVAIGIGIITLSGTLGIALPWLRLSVVGSIVYELSAAETAAGAVGAKLGEVLNAQQFTTIAWTMTLGIAIGVIITPIFCKPVLTGVSKIGTKDKAWGEHFTNAIFFALIATFVGIGVSGVTVDAAGKVTALVLVISALTMVILGVLRKALGWKWVNDYALPICMVVGMASAIPLTAWLGA